MGSGMIKKFIVIFVVFSFLVISLNSTGIKIETDIDNRDFCNKDLPLTDQDIKIIQNEIDENDFSYTVDINPATDKTIDELCGLDFPDDWMDNAKFIDPIANPKFGKTSGLPASFDWREEANGLPPIKAQEDCGSCWAFATVGALECAIRIWDGKIVDLSEQFLVSCATEYSGCNGGFFAHNHHVNPGAVYESDFPYEAIDYRGCKGNYQCGYDPVECIDCDHCYKIQDWAYLDGTRHSLPSIQSIKQAIYDYGPVAVSVYVDNKLHSYTGGIFDSNVKETTNHAVVLVGWKDDSNVKNGGYWILRNSWGAGWGENGYMRIAYECNDVGYAASFIDYKSGQSPPLPPPNGDEDYTISFEVIEITNNPSEGYGQIDSSDDPDGGDKPEWYYRVYFESETSEEYYQEKNANGNFDWISDYTWNVNKRHDFKSNNNLVKITFCLYDRDKIGYDTADLSAISSDSYFRIYYDGSTQSFDIEKSNPFTKENGVYITQGDGKYNAKLKFSISVEDNSLNKNYQTSKNMLPFEFLLYNLMNLLSLRFNNGQVVL